jgi:hypothetical protein
MAKGMIRTVLGLMVVGAFVGGSIASYENHADKAPVAKSQTKPVVQKANTQPAPQSANLESKPTWEYKTFTDPIDGTSSKSAFLDSANTVKLSFPYSDKTAIMLRATKFSSGNTRLDIVALSGQLTCRQLCTVRVRIDNQEPLGIGAVDDSTPGKSDTLNLEKSLVAKLATANKVLIEVDFFTDGRKVFEFYPKGLTL